jgi:hypothetical protein
MERLRFQRDICKIGAARRVFMSGASFLALCSFVIFALTVFPLLFWGCSDDKFGSDSSSGKQISFRLQGNLPSSRTTGTTVDNINAFVVNAQVHDKDDVILPGDDGKLFSSQTVARQEGQFNAFDYNPKRYYPDAAEKAYYSAYSPVTKYVDGFGGSPDNTITYTVPAPDKDNGDTTQEDLLVAYTKVDGVALTSGAAPSSRGGFDTPVSLNFKHALSRVFVRASNKNTEPVVITKLSLNNLYNEGMLKIDGDINEAAAEYKVLWERTGRESEKLTSYPYVLLPTGVSVPAGTEDNPVYIVGKDQGMLVLPQTTVNTGNDAEIKEPAEVSTDFYVEVTYRLSNIQRTVRAAFTDINKLAQGLTFEMGRQYALTLGFEDTDIKFDIKVEAWDDNTEEPAYAATTVVFAENKPEGVTDIDFTSCSITDNTCSKFIYGQSIEETTGGPTGDVLGKAAPSLAGYIFLGYFDSRDGGTQYFSSDADGKLKLADANVPFFDGATWNKVGPSCTLYAHWEEYYPNQAQSNIYFSPDLNADPSGNIGILTFLEKGATDQEKGYQGLYFKWGSLIGVSAAVGGNSVFSAAYLYIPDVSTGKYYKVKVGGVITSSVKAVEDFHAVVSGWTGDNGGYYPDNDWGRIPYGDATGYSTGRDESPLTDASQALYSSYKGDICRFLTEKGVSGLKKSWVMPKSELFGGVENDYYSFDVEGKTVDPALSGVTYSKEEPGWSSSNPPSFTIPSAAAEGEDGRGYTAAALVTFTTAANESATFPASGYRNVDDGALNDVGGNGVYWSSSVSGASYAYDLYFYSSNVSPASYDDRAWGLSVRCVQN